jgi:hypothetical protein
MSDSITQPELAARCEWVGQRSLKALMATGSLDPDFYFSKGPGALLHRLHMKEFGPWMNSPKLKAHLFAVIRLIIEREGYDCMIFATDSWMFQANDRYLALSEAERRALTDTGFARLVELGYGTRSEALQVTAQTPTLSHAYAVLYTRRGAQITPGETRSEAGAFAGGRAAMFMRSGEPDMSGAYQRAQQVLNSLEALGFDFRKSTELVNIATQTP